MINIINQPNTQTAIKMQMPSTPNLLLRLEGLTIFIAAIAAYAHQGGSIWWFLVLLLAPDLSAVGYLINVRVGSMTYNAAHLYTIPVVLAGAALALNMPTMLLIALIWFAHIGMDRVAGYGFKYATDFKDTHMQHV